MTTLSIPSTERTPERDTPRDKTDQKPRPESAERFRTALHPQKQANAAAAKAPYVATTRQGHNPAVTRAFPHANPQLAATLKQNKAALPQPSAQPPASLPMAGQAAGAQTLAELKQLATQPQTNAAESSANSAEASLATATTTAEATPTLATQAQAVATPAAHSPTQPGPQAPLANPALLQQVVEFAAVSRNADGQSEFRLGFQQNTLDGARLKLTRLGRGRVSLQVTGSGINDSDVQQLVASLKTRRVEVAEVEFV